MISLPAARAKSADAGWQDEIGDLDAALYAAVAATPTPALDHYFRGLSRAADHSKLWIGAAGVLAATGGRRGRHAAVNGLASIAVSSAVVNLLVKPLSRRRRPDRRGHDVPFARRVAMPRSTSFPSGHAASAFAFAAGVGIALPRAGLPLAPLRRWSLTRASTLASITRATQSPDRSSAPAWLRQSWPRSTAAGPLPLSQLDEWVQRVPLDALRGHVVVMRRQSGWRRTRTPRHSFYAASEPSWLAGLPDDGWVTSLLLIGTPATR